MLTYYIYLPTLNHSFPFVLLNMIKCLVLYKNVYEENGGDVKNLIRNVIRTVSLTNITLFYIQLRACNKHAIKADISAKMDSKTQDRKLTLSASSSRLKMVETSVVNEISAKCACYS